MQIRLNGGSREVEDGITVGLLLRELGLQPLRVAVQVNLEILRREQFETARLRAGDEVEVLTLMAGG